MPKFFKLLFGQVVIAVLVGIVAGVLYPEFAASLKPLGDAFIKLIKMLIAPIVFCVVVLGIAGDLKKVGRVGVKAVVYFELVTTIALVLGLALAYFFEPGVGMNVDLKSLDAAALSSYVDRASQVKSQGTVEFLMKLIPTTFVNAFASGDVVPPGLGWSVDPYGAVIREGYMYGRGVAVSKSDFATYAYALAALQASGAKLNGTVELHFTYDEEAGGLLGPGWLLQQGLTRPDYAISAGFAYGITTAHNGCLHLEVEVLGKSAHAAMPESGVDALEAACGVLAELYAIRRGYAQNKSKVDGIGAPKLTVGLIEGGINTNVVPDKVLFRLDRRIIPEEDPQAVEETLTRQIEQAAARWPGIGCRVRRILLAAPFVPMPGQERLVAAIARHACPIMGEEVRPHGVPLYTDARLYSAAGIPTVLYGAGPHSLLEANGHRADEKLRLEDLYKATRVVALALLDLLGE